MDTLQAFLSASTNINDEVFIKRLDTHITIKALLDEEVNDLKDQATYFTGKGAKRQKKLNDDEFNGLLIATACVNIDFSNAELLKKYGAKDAAECVRKALLSGEVFKLQNAILKLSGFEDDEETLDEIKN